MVQIAHIYFISGEIFGSQLGVLGFETPNICIIMDFEVATLGFVVEIILVRNFILAPNLYSLFGISYKLQIRLFGILGTYCYSFQGCASHKFV